MTRVTVNLTKEQAAALKARAEETGVPQSTQIRKAIEAHLLLPARRVLNSVPTSVLFTKQQETR
jgi:hypothetical protein